MMNALSWIFVVVIVLVFTKLTILDLLCAAIIVFMIAFAIALFCALVRTIYLWMIR